jgi:hypothetical protein
MPEAPKKGVERRINEADEIAINKAERICGRGMTSEIFAEFAVDDPAILALRNDAEVTDYIFKKVMESLVVRLEERDGVLPDEVALADEFIAELNRDRRRRAPIA